MSVHIFAVRVETFRLVAAEVHDQAAAALLDAGQPILLGTVEDLHKLAARLQRPLLTISRARADVPAWNPTPTRDSRPQPSLAAFGVRTRPVRGEELYPRAVQPAADREPGADRGPGGLAARGTVTRATERVR